MAAEKAILCVLFEEFSEHLNRVKGFVETEMEAHILPNSD